VLDDGRVLYDTRVICEYLDTLHAGPRLFPQVAVRRWTALRRQALGDGLMDALLLWRQERERAQPGGRLLEAFAVKSVASLAALEREADAPGRSAQPHFISPLATFAPISSATPMPRLGNRASMAALSAAESVALGSSSSKAVR
jgi:glutathione S-transferase